MITIQYLEPSADLAQLEPGVVQDRLRAAAQRLPFSHLLIGWDLPPRLLEACRQEAERLGVRFLRWHPLLSGDGVFMPRPEWQVLSLQGRRIEGFRGMPEFTFVCPNHPEVQEAVLRRLENLLATGLYQGFFLDRVRFPSPAGPPERSEAQSKPPERSEAQSKDAPSALSAIPIAPLGCFCEFCRRKASAAGLHLESARQAILQQTQTAPGRQALVQALLGSGPGQVTGALGEVLDFRARSVTDFVALVVQPLRSAGVEIGLDCFSPCLAWMVGQELGALGRLVDWIKVMSYAHTLGPAGLPFELLGLLDFLTAAAGLEEAQALDWLGQASGLPLPATRRALETDGLSSLALQLELRRGKARMPGAPDTAALLAGIELVEIESVAHLNHVQIQADLAAVARSGVDGLSISWDLWHIPLERLELVRK